MSLFGVILVRIFPAFSRIRTEYGEIRRISPYSVRMRKNEDQNNSKYGHFLRSDFVNLVDYVSMLIKLMLIMFVMNLC